MSLLFHHHKAWGEMFRKHCLLVHFSFQKNILKSLFILNYPTLDIFLQMQGQLKMSGSLLPNDSAFQPPPTGNKIPNGRH